MRIEELYARRQRRTVTVAETAEILGVAEWRFRRWGMRYDAEIRLAIGLPRNFTISGNIRAHLRETRRLIEEVNEDEK
jgi:hypothetical protein